MKKFKVDFEVGCVVIGNKRYRVEKGIVEVDDKHYETLLKDKRFELIEWQGEGQEQEQKKVIKRSK